jgi:hypothetical protein
LVFDDWDYEDIYIGIDVNNSNFVLSKPKKYEFMKNYLWGYKAEMAVGFEEARNLIDEYLNQPK